MRSAQPTPPESRDAAAGSQAVFNAKVSQVMRSEIFTIYEDTTAREAIDLVVQHKIAGIPIVSDEGKLLGVVSEKELLLAAARGDLDSPIQACSTPDHVTAEAPLKEALVKMIKNNRKWLPIVDDEDRVQGVLARRDLLEFFLSQE